MSCVGGDYFSSKVKDKQDKRKASPKTYKPDITILSLTQGCQMKLESFLSL